MVSRINGPIPWRATGDTPSHLEGPVRGGGGGGYSMVLLVQVVQLV